VAKLLEQPIPKMERPIGAALLERISWDDLRVFVVAARTLSFRKAATALRTSTQTVMRCIERLESIFEFRLFDRLPDGLGLTEEGQRVYRTSQEMERASHSLRAHLDQDLNVRGLVRCSVTEGLGTSWILPQLLQFNRAHPATIIDLRCAMEVAEVMRMEADVAVQLQKPSRPDAKSLRLGRLHIYPFASRQYVDTYGLPKNLDEVRHHRLIHQKAAQVEDDAYAACSICRVSKALSRYAQTQARHLDTQSSSGWALDHCRHTSSDLEATSFRSISGSGIRLTSG